MPDSNGLSPLPRTVLKPLRVKRCRSQYAALPFKAVDGQLVVMLVTSRGTGRWIIPKGWPEKKLKPCDQAAREAYEEAGVLGRVAKTPFGSFSYEKRQAARKPVRCLVDVYLLEVRRELEDWPEKGQREKCWMPLAEAARLVSEPGLVEIFNNIDIRRLPGARTP